MADPLVLGIVVLFSAAMSPLAVFGVLYGLPHSGAGVASGNATTNETLVQTIQNAPALVNLYDIKGDNPEQVLANAYNQSAYEEISRCASSSADNSFCETTMSMLIHSCQDNATWVSACDDPRVAAYH